MARERVRALAAPEQGTGQATSNHVDRRSLGSRVDLNQCKADNQAHLHSRDEASQHLPCTRLR